MRDVGLLGMNNGGLDKRADREFGIFFTIDTNMQFQTSLKGLNLCVVVAYGKFQTLADYEEPIKRIKAEIGLLEPGTYYLLEI